MNLNELAGLLGADATATLVSATNKVSLAAATLGVEVTPEDVVGIESVKLAVLADMPLNIEKALEELAAQPAVAKRLAAKAQEDALTEGKLDALKRLGTLSRADRMSAARRLGLDGSKPAKEERSLAEHLDVLSGLSPQQRMAYARRHGIVG